MNTVGMIQEIINEINRESEYFNRLGVTQERLCQFQNALTSGAVSAEEAIEQAIHGLDLSDANRHEVVQWLSKLASYCDPGL